MKNIFKKGMALTLASAMLATSLAGCSNSASSSSSQASSVESTTSTVDASMPYAGTKLKYAATDTLAATDETQQLVEMVKEKTGIEIEFVSIPADEGDVDKLLLMLQTGQEDIDIINKSTPLLQTYYEAGVLQPVDELAKADGYDMEKVFGVNLPVFSDGATYGLPAYNDIWLTVYNKQIFDDAGVAYPTAENFTWDKYVETAKELTDTSTGVWGSYMLDYDNYNYMLATQKGANPYKADGTANFDDPLYKESLEFFYGLGTTEKIQPDSVVYAADYKWNSFMSEGKMGMWVIGGWSLSMLTNTDKYPRDWKAGIVPMPYPEGSDASTLTVTGDYAIPASSSNAAAAFEAIKCIAENQYTLGHGRVPARVDLTDAEIDAYIKETLVPTYAADGITLEDFKACWFDSNRTLYSEKIVGTADVQINKIWLEQGNEFGRGSQTADETIANIQEESNKAIQEALNS